MCYQYHYDSGKKNYTIMMWYDLTQLSVCDEIWFSSSQFHMYGIIFVEKGLNGFQYLKSS